MKFEINLLDKYRVESCFENLKIIADQPAEKGGSGEYPSPYDYFLSSIGLCAGYYIQSYCRARNIETSNIKIVQQNTKKDDGSNRMLIEIEIRLPEEMSEKDRIGILRSVEGCTVKKAIVNMPEFLVKIS